MIFLPLFMLFLDHELSCRNTEVQTLSIVVEDELVSSTFVAPLSHQEKLSCRITMRLTMCWCIR